MDNDLIQLLKSTGLKEKEARVYLALLELSQGTVSQIAKLSDLKRPIIYIILQDLISRGYVNQLPEKKINEYQAIDPSAIVIEQKTAIKNFTEMIPFLQTLHNKGRGRPKIHYIENKKGIWKIYEEMGYAKEVLFFTSLSKIEKYYPTEYKRWIGNLQKRVYKLAGRYLIGENAEDMKLGKEFNKAEQKVKYLPGVKQLSMDFAVYDNKLAITSLEEEPFLVLIESESLVNSIRPIFEIAWKAGQPV